MSIMDMERWLTVMVEFKMEIGLMVSFKDNEKCGKIP